MYDLASRKLVSYYQQTDPILDMSYPEYRLDYHLFPASDNLMFFYDMLSLHKRNI